MSLNCQVQINLNNLSKEKALSVKQALDPDNVKFPKGLRLKVEIENDKLIFNFENDEDMKKLISTVDEVLSHIQVSMKVIE